MPFVFKGLINHLLFRQIVKVFTDVCVYEWAVENLPTASLNVN